MLNTKLGTVKNGEKALKASFKNKDMERDNFIKNKITKPINECEKDIFGDKISLDEDSMVARKKDII